MESHSPDKTDAQHTAAHTRDTLDSDCGVYNWSVITAVLVPSKPLVIGDRWSN